MSDDEHDEPAKRSKRWAWVVMLPFLYVLSFGPANWLLAWLYRNDPGTWQGFPIDVYQFVYWPLKWLRSQYPWFGSALEWYCVWR